MGEKTPPAVLRNRTLGRVLDSERMTLGRVLNRPSTPWRQPAGRLPLLIATVYHIV
jgi:hypothetical protein